MNIAFQRLLTALGQPELMTTLSAVDWDALLRHSRSAGLLSRLALEVQACEGWDSLPERVRQHMRAAIHVANRQIRAVRWEVHKVHEALDHLDIPIVLLKGAAYVMADLPPSRGRLFGDIDLLVPRQSLDAVEMQLLLHGWHGTHREPYDQRYYREWMHEIPPLTHISRGSTLDIHHNILPLTARLRPQAKDLFEAIIPIPGYHNLYRLGDADLVLHSTTHLFHEGEWGHGLRDLVDLDALLRHFGRDSTFWQRLVERAHILNLLKPLRFALYFTHKLLGTPICDYKADALVQTGTGMLTTPLFMQAFASAHAEMAAPISGVVLSFLYVRGHWLRMPFHQLIPHLMHKAKIRAVAQNSQR
jgi:Uncharacterised nucleotidyltransferase